MAVKITLGNSKGGVGKTIITNLLAFHLAEEGKRVLLVDLDPQGNSTLINRLKYGFPEGGLKLIDGIAAKDLSICITPVEENLHLIQGDMSTVKLDYLFEKGSKLTKSNVLHLSKLIEKIESNYDFIFFDVPPTVTGVYLNNALGASDYFIVITEATQQSLSGIEQFIGTGASIQKHFNARLDCLGILINRREKNTESFKDLVKQYDLLEDVSFFENIIPARARISLYSDYGIYNYSQVKNNIQEDIWDKRIKNDHMLPLVAELKQRLVQSVNEV